MITWQRITDRFMRNTRKEVIDCLKKVIVWILLGSVLEDGQLSEKTILLLKMDVVIMFGYVNVIAEQLDQFYNIVWSREGQNLVDVIAEIKRINCTQNMECLLQGFMEYGIR